MPIRPENRDRYPADWPEISLRIRERAGNRCEKCDVENHALGCRTRDGVFLPALPVERLARMVWPKPGDKAWCGAGTRGVYGKVMRIVLTVAHLDHTPENCADENLRAWCQRCHLNYDRHIHQANLRETIRRRRAIADLFAEAA